MIKKYTNNMNTDLATVEKVWHEHSLLVMGGIQTEQSTPTLLSPGLQMSK